MKNIKVAAYATSHLKSDDKGDSRSFSLFVTFLPLLILESEGLYLLTVNIKVAAHSTSFLKSDDKRDSR